MSEKTFSRIRQRALPDNCTLTYNDPAMVSTETPMMQQWKACKERSGDAILLFRLGDFYEAFHDDADLIARELELTLTKRHDVPMAGIPFHASEPYIDQLISKGFRVAIAEQTEDPGQTKKLVRREVVRVLTPGTAIESSLVSEKASHYIASLTHVGHILGLSILELSIGQFSVVECEHPSDLAAELARLAPAEVVVSERTKGKYQALLDDLRLRLTVRPDWSFDHETACETLGSHFQVRSLDGFGLRGMVAAISAAGALITYLRSELCLDLRHVQQVNPYSIVDAVSLDPVTQKNLLLSGNAHDCRSSTLLGVLDRTRTPMGGRTLREWVRRPLCRVEAILARQHRVAALRFDEALRYRLANALSQIRDVERLAMKVSAGWANPRDLKALGHSLSQLPTVAQIVDGHALLGPLALSVTDLSTLAEEILQTLSDEPPARISDGGAIRAGVCPELDELLSLHQSSHDHLLAYQIRMRESTGIKTLKVGYNRVFGYFLEVSKGQADRVPSDFIRRQTLANAERFISSELKEYETKVLGAQGRIATLESTLFAQLRERVAGHTQEILEVGRRVAQLDALQSLAQVAHERNYIQPIVDHSLNLFIEGGRHPVVEQRPEPFIPNDTQMDQETERLLLITGPNMAGKSTYIRQVALLVLMAQIGSFIPAQKAHIGIVDKIFTRIGASDDLARGQSTFMVEMAETANILRNSTGRSLVILDEIGRGTSTYDGVSIAWAVAEYLLTQVRARTLFATHYFELTQLELKVPGAVNYNVAVQEDRGQVVFLHQIVRGCADRSYGIHVAKLAGLPPSVIARACDILQQLEEAAPSTRLAQKQSRMLGRELKDSVQLSLFSR